MSASSETVSFVLERLSTLRRRAGLRAVRGVAERIPEPRSWESMSVSRQRAAWLNAAEGAADDAHELLATLRRLEREVHLAETELARRDVLVRHLRDSATSGRALRADLAALGRWMDLEAVTDRFDARRATLDMETAVALEALARDIEHGPPADAPLPVARVARLAGPDHSTVVRVEALRVLLAEVEKRPDDQRLATLGPALARRVVVWAREPSSPPWVQVAALELAACALGEEAVPVVRDRLRNRRGGDDFIVRARAVRLLERLRGGDSVAELLKEALSDPSEHVRQELARTLGARRGQRATQQLGVLARTDQAATVRGAAIVALAKRALRFRGELDAVELFVQVLSYERAPVPLRIVLEELTSVAGPLGVLPPSQVASALSKLCQDSTLPPSLRERAAATARALEVDHDAIASGVRDHILEVLPRLEEGQEAALRLEGGDPPFDVLVRALRVAGRGDMTVTLRRARGGWRLGRGERRTGRLWRLLHELTSPAPDKRQGFLHGSAREGRHCQVVVPPVGMAELTATRVPGERRHHASVDGWAPFVPRVDDLLTATRSDSPMLLVTSLGDVKLTPPRGRAARISARLRLVLRYRSLAEAREWAIGSSEPSDQRKYIDRVKRLGFSVELGATEGELGGARYRLEPSPASPYLGVFVAPFLAPSWVDEMVRYALSPHGNDLTQLAWFAWVLIVALLIWRAASMARIERCTADIPLTIGGWGTRGKSGCERLKAALFQGLGYQVAVKTTGCEAVLLHGVPGGPARETFIFRAFDKATIWEQRDLLDAASRLEVDVFLWECMALRERYVKLLLHDWMQGMLTTITNAYPDHEDVMGPSGEDVARVIGQFVPNGGTAITAEDQMLPVLRESARARKSELIEVGARESDLLPADLIDRFPYQEHPRNIALVARLAEHLGVPRDVAIVEMADHVVPDLGVLKTYPVEFHRGRQLFFSNGMSANERVGYLSNWRRLGLDEYDRDRNGDLCVALVVNNRADRVPRSRVFAKIMVEDTPCEVHLIIGTNLEGMKDLLQEALTSHLEKVWVRRDGDPEDVVRGRFDAEMRRLRVPVDAAGLPASLVRMLRVVLLDEERAKAAVEQQDVARWLSAVEAGEETAAAGLVDSLARLESELDERVKPLWQDVVKHVARLARRVTHARKGWNDVARAATAEAANQVFRDTARVLFSESVVYLDDAGASGDHVLDFAARECPPGHRVHLVGVQNIKGAGLDFAYRWVSIGEVHSALTRLRGQPSERAATLRWLRAHRDYGLLDARRALSEVRRARYLASEDSAWAPHRNALEALVGELEEVVRQRQAKLEVRRPGWTSGVLGRVERLFDTYDSLRRRRRADRVLRDLVRRRVGRGRAARLLRDVGSRQKGGWLERDLRAWRGSKEDG